MKNSLYTLLTSIIVGLVVCGFTTLSMNQTTIINREVGSFSLRNTDNRMVSLSDYPGAKGFIVIFTCNHCPFAALYSKRLNNLNTKYSPIGVPLIAINSMDTLMYEDENFELMQQKASAAKFNFPYLHDPTQKVGKAFSASYTPQAYILWRENNKWVIRYRGAIDNNGQQPNNAKPFIENAIEELLVGKQVSKPETQSIGCAISYRDK